ncbi:hypothetical protein F3Y22_tig00002799pilonHSYRG00158 [Hibiscus syriacus]|uniref:Uncharacterized protein n=1 Tax=Hibiscus syriacus TaxID=106335 RepID=A0A6A3CQT8_HIBSY|nr:uncharacterized protein LOC120151238 [Hibiscus syriacus]KAE8731553.1 hypothetical protein F3Y22_tig00002799pilonHSYRG00158 [Hibiscus syriacus]
MEAASLCSSSSFFPSLLPPTTFPRSWHEKRSRDGPIYTARGDSRRWDHGGQLVDENLIVLRKRIHDMKIVERNYEPPSDWMEWEKPYYTSYNECVCRIMGLLQSCLMNTKPSSALGILALLTMCLQGSVIMVVVHLVIAAKGVLSTINLH